MDTELIVAWCILSFISGALAMMILFTLMENSIEKKYPRSK